MKFRVIHACVQHRAWWLSALSSQLTPRVDLHNLTTNSRSVALSTLIFIQPSKFSFGSAAPRQTSIMTYTLLLFVPRKSGISSEAFKHHWETSHVPLLKQLVGREFPLSHTRHYLEASQANHSNIENNDAEEVMYDGFAILTFINKVHYERFMDKLGDEESGRRHSEDLRRFVDVERLRLVRAGETRSTGKDGQSVGWRFVGNV
jgi:hypothetical protein